MVFVKILDPLRNWIFFSNLKKARGIVEAAPIKSKGTKLKLIFWGKDCPYQQSDLEYEVYRENRSGSFEETKLWIWSI